MELVYADSVRQNHEYCKDEWRYCIRSTVRARNIIVEEISVSFIELLEDTDLRENTEVTLLWS
jgi:hypothetical protein